MPNNEEAISLDVYKKYLIKFLDEYILTCQKEILSSMDLLRLYFRINDIRSANKMIHNMADSPDVRMLKFYIKYYSYHKNDWPSLYIKINNSLNDKPYTDHSSRNDTLVNENFINNQNEPMRSIQKFGKSSVQQFLSIAKDLDEKTRTIFIIDMINLIPCDIFILLIDQFKIRDAYSEIYLRIKLCETLIKNNRVKTAVFMLISTSLKITSAQDIILRNELVKIALKHVDSKNWLTLILKALEIVRNKEIKSYGTSLTTSVDLLDNCCYDFDFLVNLKGNNMQTSKITVQAQFEIFRFDLFRSVLSGTFVDKLKIYNKSNLSIDAIILSDDGVVPIYKSDSEIIVDLKRITPEEDDFIVKGLLCSDGKILPLDQKFRRIRRDNDILLKDVYFIDGKYIYTFDIVGVLVDIYLEGHVGSYEMADKILTVHLNSHVNRFTIEIEIKRGIYEEKVYHVK